MDNLIQRFSVIHRQSGVNLDKGLRRLSVTTGQFLYLMFICDYPGASQENISVELQIDKASVARTVKQLEKDKYLTRTISAEDKRQYQIWPSEKAIAIYGDIQQTVGEWEHQITRSLTDIEVGILVSLLDKIIANLS